MFHVKQKRKITVNVTNHSFAFPDMERRCSFCYMCRTAKARCLFNYAFFVLICMYMRHNTCNLS